MSGDPHCPACGFEWVKSAPNPVAHVCTGRPGCVRHPERENPAPEKPPAGANVPVGKADIVERLRMCDAPFYESSPTVNESLRDDIEKAADEIARLRAETVQLVELAEYKRAEVAAVRGTVERLQADRAALAQRVAEAVREACKQAVIGTYGDARNHHRMDAIDLGPIVAAALKESAP